VIENCAVATMDGPRHDQGGTEHRSGHATVTGDRITDAGEGRLGQQSVLFDRLTELYPIWATIDAGQVHAAATAGLAWLS
jgi:hypothetical protein